MITVLAETPEQYIRQQLNGFSRAFALSYTYEQYYLPDMPVIELLALINVEFDSSGNETWSGSVGALTEFSARDSLEQPSLTKEQLQAYASELNWPWLNLDSALPLKPISIKKPWGQEIWFTGIEERGLSLVGDDNAASPLPWVLSMAPQRLCDGLHQQINLLKILDPLPEEVFGDLYFELHEEKQEVYVVTHVDSGAWPSGMGGIRFGFSQEVRQEYTTDETFKQAFSNAVKAYESIRRVIDAELDKKRKLESIALDAPVMADQTKIWLAELPSELQEQELALRQTMDHFKATKPLQLGDVVKVPCFTPHSLMHGVRTIEFQTPVYERQILCFAQKVLTQDHWDTDKAIGCMNLDKPEDEPLKQLRSANGVTVDEVVDFDDFCVWRIAISEGQSWQLPEFQYALAIGLNGQPQFSQSPLNQEEGILLPTQMSAEVISNDTNSTALFLLALPK